MASFGGLLPSLVLLLGDVVAAFVYFADQNDRLWGMLLRISGALGFGGFLALMALAGWRELLEARRVQVIPPPHHNGSPSQD